MVQGFIIQLSNVIFMIRVNVSQSLTVSINLYSELLLLTLQLFYQDNKIFSNTLLRWSAGPVFCICVKSLGLETSESVPRTLWMKDSGLTVLVCTISGSVNSGTAPAWTSVNTLTAGVQRNSSLQDQHETLLSSCETPAEIMATLSEWVEEIPQCIMTWAYHSSESEVTWHSLIQSQNFIIKFFEFDLISHGLE